MNISTEQVFIVNSTEIEPHNHLTPEVPLQRNFAMPVAAIHPEDPQSSGICLPQSSLEPSSRSQTCRLCAAVTDMVVPIFEGEGLQNCLADKIHQHLPIQVSEKDVLPVVMCFQCTSTLLAWHELVICSVQADAVMRERLNQQHQPQQPPTAESSQTQFKQEKSSIREDAQASVPCEHCTVRLPDTELRAHMLTAHAHLLFLCAECRLYLARKNMLAHMATHVELNRNDQKNMENSITEQKVQETLITRQKLPENSITQVPIPSQAHIIPIIRIQRLSKIFVSPPPLILNSSAIKLQHVLLTNDVQKSPPSEPVLNTSKTSDSLEPPAKKTDEENLENTISESNSEINSNDGVRNFELSDRDSLEKQTITTHSKETEEKDPAQTNDFSDQSDTENEFGRLPESVFDAIEDSQDATNIDNLNSTDTETNNTEIINSKANLPRPCPLCQKLCTSLSGWYYHLKRAHGTNKNLTCNVCTKIFKSKTELATHSRTHTKEKPFGCRICESLFSSRAGRYIHEQTHGTKRSHVCDRCPKAFRWKAQLSRHLARHDVKKNHVCTQCGRAFSVAFDLARHMRSHNPGCHKCDLCNATFKQKRYLKVHMENIHLRNVASTSTDATKVCRKSKEKSDPELLASDQKTSIDRVSDRDTEIE